MSFNIIQFIRTNKVLFIWVAFGSLLYLFRDMFGLVFITYVMCFIAHGLTRGLSKFTGLKRRLLVILLYLVFLVLVLGLFSFIIPKILGEAKHFANQLPASLKPINEWLNVWVEDNPSLAPVVGKIRETFTLELMVGRGLNMGEELLQHIYNYFSWFFLGILFSFLIMFDLPNLTRRLRSLRFTRLAAIYAETSASVVLFARVVGENFRAQILISLINTCLTAIGLNILGVGTVALLCSIVFICGLIPVLGVIISSVPIILVAINVGGFHLALWVIIMILIIHAIEAYILNPRIVSAIMHLNPVMTLMILYIAHSLLGLWGMLLGVPISVYIYRQLILGATKKSKICCKSENALLTECTEEQPSQADEPENNEGK